MQEVRAYLVVVQALAADLQVAQAPVAVQQEEGPLAGQEGGYLACASENDHIVMK